MTSKIESKNMNSNIINLNNYKRKNKQITSTIAAIIAVNIQHPVDTSPEDYLIDNIELNENIELVPFEDALEDLIDNSQVENTNNSKNFVNDA